MLASNRKKIYTEEFKANAVKLSYTSTKSVVTIASELGIAESVLYKWRNMSSSNNNKTTVTKGASANNELLKLKQENEQLKKALLKSERETEILKKCIAFFAKE